MVDLLLKKAEFQKPLISLHNLAGKITTTYAV